MNLVSTITEVRSCVKAWRTEGLTVGFVPTMGYLHEGHQSLIKRAAAENDRVVVSIFLNPIQFGKNEDLSVYPRDLERDKKVCEEGGADLIFHPEPDEMYSRDFCTYVDMGGLTETLCGASRPGHFRGVCTVVAKLFNIVKADRAYFGRKDAQQLVIVKKMAADLDMDIEVIGWETVRAADGLAMSSRNVYLEGTDREAAVILPKALQAAEDMIRRGERDSAAVKKAIGELIGTEPRASLEYAEVVDPDTLQPVDRIKKPALVAAAMRIGKTRLIDNFFYV